MKQSAGKKNNELNGAGQLTFFIFIYLESFEESFLGEAPQEAWWDQGEKAKSFIRNTVNEYKCTF